MQVGPQQHLTYCLNVHAGETWDEALAAMHEKTLAVREKVCGGQPFGLGLRLGAGAAQELLQPDRLEAFRAFLAQNRLYVFTINGFPYGAFHRTRVKEHVYAPDWRARERVEYTQALAEVLAALLPEACEGSISTVPGSYKPWVHTPEDRRTIACNLVRMAAYLAGLADRTGRMIHLGLEPEPDCLLETTAEAIAFFAEDLPAAAAAMAQAEGAGRGHDLPALVQRHLGVCVDTCHVAVQFEDVTASLAALVEADVKISKVQLSAALSVAGCDATSESLGAFADPVYLHQVRVRAPDGQIRRYPDLPELLASGACESNAEVRIHCHVPLYWQGNETLKSTHTSMGTDFFRRLTRAPCPHLEIETYTFDVLPEALRRQGVVASIASEFDWVLPQMPTTGCAAAV